MAAEGEAPEHEEGQQGVAEDWDAPGEPGDLSSLSAQTEWLNQQPMVGAAAAARDAAAPAPRPARTPVAGRRRAACSGAACSGRDLA